MITLGIDYGTTKNAAVLYDNENPDDYEAVSAPHFAELPNAAHPDYAEQDIRKVHQSILDLIAQLPMEKRQKIKAIGFTGQMHSIVAWNDHDLSPVVTWQDKRATANGRLARYRQATRLPLADGFGGVTLAEYASEGTLSRWTHVASPVDWLAAQFTNSPYAMMEPTFAASWGIWDIRNNTWNQQALSCLNIPADILPKPVSSGTIIGVTDGVPGLPDGIPVLASLGDNQASVLGTATIPAQEIFLTLGTGAQLSVVLSKAEAEAWTLPAGVELRPFLNDTFLAVNAPLCGGKAWAWLGTAVNSMLASLGLQPFDDKQLLDLLDTLALTGDSNSGLEVTPDFLGQRIAPETRAEITGINLENFTLPNLARALGQGIISQLFKPFPAQLLSSRQRVIGSGNCVRFCKSIQHEIVRQSGLPLELHNLKEEAALGAAKLAARLKLPSGITIAT